jgi:hypothetical protein
MIFHIRFGPNKGVNFVHLMNYLVSREIMILTQAISLYGRFKLGEDISVDIPNGLAGEFRGVLNSLGFVIE